MYPTTPYPPQQWSVHAEFTINHPGVRNPLNPPKTETVQDENGGIKMLYSWKQTDPAAQVDRSESGSSKTYEHDRLYGFQKGNLFFTSTPPSKPTSHLNVPVHDSAYGSEMLSTVSCNSSSCHPFNRKCKSTCNIILSSSTKGKGHADNVPYGHASSYRTHSLRCQTPSACSDTRSDGLYGCGDPWCHHLHYNDDFSSVRKVSPVKELCEDFNNASRENCGEPGCSICVRENEANRSIKRDVSVQTYEMVSKCTSPMLITSENEKPITTDKTAKLKRGRTMGGKRSRRSSRGSASASPVLHDRNLSEKNTKPNRSSNQKRNPIESIDSDTKSGDSSKKPRTIHIDVYCTGTDMESDSSSSSSSSRSKTVSTPQTVFESKGVSVTHTNADDKILPYHLKKSSSIPNKYPLDGLSKTSSVSMEKEDSDASSTAYPSKMSSYSTIGQSLSSMSSFPHSITANSMSTYTVPDYESSIGNTSWKDTFSDIDSLLHSRSSIPQNDSLYFIPKRIEEETSGKEDSSKVTSTANSVNLHPSDSFEYADSEDKLRILRMERMWKSRMHAIDNESKKKLLQQQEDLQDIVNRRLKRMNVSKSKDSDSDASDKSEKGWTVLKTEDVREPDVKRPVYKSPSAVIIKEKLSSDPSLGAPFTIFPGHFTEPRYIARKFGPVVTVFKKPGHHIGPAKNPNCSCEHCRRYFQNIGFRNRTCSVGDAPTTPFFNWKGLKKND